ncbi:hypothetical protein WG954_18220 [Lacibacter sp. H375]|uniref:hypothetical protein n=1 Tax=Lacibacter sp. H375 TaxID=3133424 RepID=UPI0030C4C751
MEKEQLIKEAKRIGALGDRSSLRIESREFIRRFVGESSDFYKILNNPITDWNEFERRAKNVMASFVRFTENGLMSNLSYEREIQIETVSDFLDQANSLLSDSKIHASAPAVLIGASLEEFLRTWLEQEGVDLTTIKNSLDSYAQELKKKDLINKQDYKDITAWGGTRNDAAHGHFDEVNDRQKIKLMLEGVNLFIRKYTPQ